MTVRILVKQIGKKKKKMELIETYHNYLRDINQFHADKEGLIAALPDPLRGIIEDHGVLRPQDLSYTELYQLYVDKLRELADYELTIDDNNRDCIEQVVAYMGRNSKFKGSPDKGLIIRGPVGTGKTLLFQGLRKLYDAFQYNMTIIDTYDIAAWYVKSGPSIYDEVFPGGRLDIILSRSDNIVFDDLGAEAESKYYGTNANCMGEIVLRRYKAQAKSYFTSNLDIKSLKQIYGERVTSRLKQMSNDIILKGDDRRK